jgi:predicted NAD/FAD-dependent oxidoreductase
VTIFEKSKGFGGRAATRKQAGFIYDHGTQYIRQGAPESISLITKRFLLPDLINISKPVWIFDGSGQIQEGDPQQNAEPKWSYRSGLTALAKRMAEGLNIHLQIQIQQVEQSQHGWELIAANGARFTGFDKLLITIPATQASELIQASPLENGLHNVLCAYLDRASYNPLISVILGYRPRPQNRPYYALVNTDRAHPISWLAWEHEKAPERAPADAGLLIAQMGPHYSKEHWQTADDSIIADTTRLVAALLHEPLAPPFFSDLQRWRYALPSEKADAEQLNTLALPLGLAFSGDAFVGGRAHLALEHGILVAGQLLQK